MLCLIKFQACVERFFLFDNVNIMLWQGFLSIALCNFCPQHSLIVVSGFRSDCFFCRHPQKPIVITGSSLFSQLWKWTELSSVKRQVFAVFERVSSYQKISEQRYPWPSICVFPLQCGVEVFRTLPEQKVHNSVLASLLPTGNRRLIDSRVGQQQIIFLMIITYLRVDRSQ